jgi:hypothetical protein
VATNDTDSATSEVAVALYGLVSFVTLAGMTLTERFGSLPAALVAFASGWYIVRRESPGPGEA